MFVDSHCHLDRLNLDKYDAGIEGAVFAAEEAGISTMLCVCISESNKDQVIAIANRFTNVFASVGVHPSDVDCPVSTECLKIWADAKKVVALGESGLDYYYAKQTKGPQQQSFENHLVAAGELGLPLIVHTREAKEDTLDLIKRYGNERSAGVLHCFTETWDMASKALDMNYYISISGIVTFKNASELREVVKKIPLNRLLIETDSPYLAPAPYRGKPNEPKYLGKVAEAVAEHRGMHVEALAEATTENFFRLFSGAQTRG